MKVIVKNNFLNVRVGKPSVNAPCYQYLAPGSELEVDGVLYEGDSYEGTTKWLKDEAGNYYWAGGVINNNSISKPEIIKDEANFDLIKKIVLKGGIPKGDGKNITIAILDSGIDISHPSLTNSIIESVDFLSSDKGQKITNNHGSLVAGLIVCNDSILKGLAPESKIRNYRVIDNNGYVDSKALFDSLAYIVNNNIHVDIINLSLDVGDDVIEIIQDNVNKLISKGCIIIVSGGNAVYINSITNLKGVISIGIFNTNDSLKTKPNYIVSYLNNSIKSTGVAVQKAYDYISDDSAYAAITTGLVSRYISSENIQKDELQLRVIDFLKNNSFPEKEENKFEIFKPYKI